MKKLLLLLALTFAFTESNAQLSLEQKIELTRDTSFQKRVRMAVVIAAIQIQGEALPVDGLVRWRKRQALSYAIINSSDQTNWPLVIVTNAAINGSSTDSDIEFTVATVFDDAAGVVAGDEQDQ